MYNKKFLIGLLSTLIAIAILVGYILWSQPVGPIAHWPDPDWPSGKHKVLGPNEMSLLGNYEDWLRSPEGTRLRIMRARRGHRVPLQTVRDWIMYVWGPEEWEIGMGWLVRVGDRYYAPEAGYGLVVRGEHEILPLGSDGPRYLIVVSPE